MHGTIWLYSCLVGLIQNRFLGNCGFFNQLEPMGENGKVFESHKDLLLFESVGHDTLLNRTVSASRLKQGEALSKKLVNDYNALHKNASDLHKYIPYPFERTFLFLGYLGS